MLAALPPRPSRPPAPGRLPNASPTLSLPTQLLAIQPGPDLLLMLDPQCKHSTYLFASFSVLPSQPLPASLTRCSDKRSPQRELAPQHKQFRAVTKTDSLRYGKHSPDLSPVMAYPEVKEEPPAEMRVRFSIPALKQRLQGWSLSNADVVVPFTDLRAADSKSPRPPKQPFRPPNSVDGDDFGQFKRRQNHRQRHLTN